MMLTLCPTGSTQPVAASGCALSGEAATQIVWDTRLTNVTTRLPAGATTAGPAGDVAGAVVRAAPRAVVGAGRAGCDRAPGTDAVAAGRAIIGAAADGADPAPLVPLTVPGAATGVPPPAAQAASSSVTVARTTAASARLGRLGRLVHFVNAICVLPLLWCSRLGDLRRSGRITEIDRSKIFVIHVPAHRSPIRHERPVTEVKVP